MNENTGKLILRVVLGLLILLHGISKLRNGIGWLDGALANAGLFAFGPVHGTELFALEPQTGALKLEVQYMYFFCAIALALIGPGRHAVNQK